MCRVSTKEDTRQPFNIWARRSHTINSDGWDRESCKNYIITRAPPTLPVFLQHWIMLEKKQAKEKCNSNSKSNHRPRRERQSTCVKESANHVRSRTARYTALEALATISGMLGRYDVHAYTSNGIRAGCNYASDTNSIFVGDGTIDIRKRPLIRYVRSSRNRFRKKLWRWKEIFRGS